MLVRLTDTLAVDPVLIASIGTDIESQRGDARITLQNGQSWLIIPCSKQRLNGMIDKVNTALTTVTIYNASTLAVPGESP